MGAVQYIVHQIRYGPYTMHIHLLFFVLMCWHPVEIMWSSGQASAQRVKDRALGKPCRDKEGGRRADLNLNKGCTPFTRTPLSL